jgi:beta-xylosidase
VQTVAQAANPSNAEAIIQSAGMAVRKTTLHDKAAPAAKPGSASGTFNLAAKAAVTRAAYTWQYSTDQKTWTTMPATLKAKTGIAGLTVGTVDYFRVQALTKMALEDWSQLVSLMVQ